MQSIHIPHIDFSLPKKWHWQQRQTASTAHSFIKSYVVTWIQFYYFISLCDYFMICFTIIPFLVPIPSNLKRDPGDKVNRKSLCHLDPMTPILWHLDLISQFILLSWLFHDFFATAIAQKFKISLITIGYLQLLCFSNSQLKCCMKNKQFLLNSVSVLQFFS